MCLGLNALQTFSTDAAQLRGLVQNCYCPKSVYLSFMSALRRRSIAVRFLSFCSEIGEKEFMFRTSRATLCIAAGIAGILAYALFSAPGRAASTEQMFKGEITDSKCAALGGHTAMLDKGESNAHCTIACVKAGAKYVLADSENKIVYQLDDQKMPEAFAAQNVVVIGALIDDSTIHVDNIVRDMPPSVKRAKSVAIVCDACPRGMSKAPRYAAEELAQWNRFVIVADPAKANLVILISANPYLGDYLSREGPDKRPVVIDATFMNVIDPRTGENLWGDSAQAGSWFISSAIKTLVDEFKEQLEADESPAQELQFLNDHRRPKAAPIVGK
jgi:hypothetical protein